MLETGLSHEFPGRFIVIVILIFFIILLNAGACRSRVKEYTASGEIYGIGKLLFDDDWSFESFKIGTWKYPGEE
jgi:hypothetical protein